MSKTRNKGHWMTTPKWFRTQIRKQRRAKERRALIRIKNKEPGAQMPRFRRDALYNWW